MGDVAMIVPSLRCLIASYPEVKITIVSNILFKPLFKEFENINFFQTDFKSHHKGVKGLMRLLRGLIKLKPTHIADLHEKIKTFICKICDNKFSRKNVLNQHVAAVHERKTSFKCEFCVKIQIADLTIIGSFPI